MIANQPVETEDQILLAFLVAQRDSVLSIVEGLDEEVRGTGRSCRRAGPPPGGSSTWAAPSGTGSRGSVAKHADPEPPPGDEDLPAYDPMAAFVSDLPSAEIIGFYRDQCARSDAVLAVTPLSAPPRGRHGDPQMDEPPNVRWVVLHMIEETARHAGHLDIARELIDGQTGLGPR